MYSEPELIRLLYTLADIQQWISDLSSLPIALCLLLTAIILRSSFVVKGRILPIYRQDKAYIERIRRINPTPGPAGYFLFTTSLPVTKKALRYRRALLLSNNIYFFWK
jgi:hypothetical protein